MRRIYIQGRWHTRVNRQEREGVASHSRHPLPLFCSRLPPPSAVFGSKKTILEKNIKKHFNVWIWSVVPESPSGEALKATEMNYWRRSAKRSRTERIPNARIKEITEAPQPIIDDIKTKQLVWFGHVQRMTESRISKQVFKWLSLGRRRKGRLRASWKSGVVKEIRAYNLGGRKPVWTGKNGAWQLEDVIVRCETDECINKRLFLWTIEMSPSINLFLEPHYSQWISCPESSKLKLFSTNSKISPDEFWELNLRDFEPSFSSLHAFGLLVLLHLQRIKLTIHQNLCKSSFRRFLRRPTDLLPLSLCANSTLGILDSSMSVRCSLYFFW